MTAVCAAGSNRNSNGCTSTRMRKPQVCGTSIGQMCVCGADVSRVAIQRGWPILRWKRYTHIVDSVFGLYVSTVVALSCCIQPRCFMACLPLPSNDTALQALHCC